MVFKFLRIKVATDAWIENFLRIGSDKLRIAQNIFKTLRNNSEHSGLNVYSKLATRNFNHKLKIYDIEHKYLNISLKSYSIIKLLKYYQTISFFSHNYSLKFFSSNLIYQWLIVIDSNKEANN